jgi:S1-C subfamily serine protease
LILTSRHVVGVTKANFWGTVEFHNHENLVCEAHHIEQLHDWALLSFDIVALREPIVVLELRPNLAVVGVEVRIIGNDAGDKANVHSGTISGTDINAPYHESGYNDSNTNYIQATIVARSGSSGGPLFNIDGFAIGLNASGQRDGKADNLFLPLDGVARTLLSLQQNKPIIRGTIQCRWKLQHYNECDGLTQEWAEIYRNACQKEGGGILVVDRVLPECPSDSRLKVGDILLRFHGEVLTGFSRHDVILDSSINEYLYIEVQRNGKHVEFEIRVDNLFDITQRHYVSVAGAIFNELSYIMALHYSLACGGVYVCNPGGSFRELGDGSIIVSVDGHYVPCLGEFVRAWKEISNQKRVVVTYRKLGNERNNILTATVINNLNWSSLEEGIECEETGLWKTNKYSAIAELPCVPMPVTFPPLENAPDMVKGLQHSFVKVSCTVPFFLNLSLQPRSSGGIIVNAQNGFICVSRTTIPQDLCNIYVTFADSATISAVVYREIPELGYTIIQYNPSLINGLVKGIDLSSDILANNSRVDFAAINARGKMICTDTKICEFDDLDVEPDFYRPIERAINIEAYFLETTLSRE